MSSLEDKISDALNLSFGDGSGKFVPKGPNDADLAADHKDSGTRASKGGDGAAKIGSVLADFEAESDALAAGNDSKALSVAPTSGIKAPMQRAAIKKKSPANSNSKVPLAKTGNGSSRPSKGMRQPAVGQNGSSDIYARAQAKREEKERHLEELRRKDASFSPKLVSSSKLRDKRASVSGKTRHEMLHEDASARKLNSQRLAVNSPELRECTFTPRTSAQTTGPVSSAQRQQRMSNLHDLAAEKEARRKQAREAALEREKQEMSFKPKITAKARKSRPASPGAGSKRFEQLHDSHKDHIRKLDAEKERRTMEGCTFTPKINHRRSLGGTPRKDRNAGSSTAANEGSVPRKQPRQISSPAGDIHERLLRNAALTEKKKEEARRAQRAREEAEMTFQPNISRRRPSPARASRGKQKDGDHGNQSVAPHGSIHERLYNEASHREHRVATDPQIRPHSRGRKPPSEEKLRRLSAPKRGGAAAVSPRNLAKNQDKGVISPEDLIECTFRPNASKPVASTKASDKVFERLHRAGAGTKEMRESQKKQEELAKCSFKPDIGPNKSTDSRSRVSLGGNKPIWERLNSEASRKAAQKKEAERIRAENEIKDCTFRPAPRTAAPASSSRVTSSKPIWERLADTTNLTQRQIELKQQKEESELEGCTFKPVLIASPSSQSPSSNGAVSPGFGAKSSPSAKLSYLEKIKNEHAASAKKSSSKKTVSAKVSPKRSPKRSTPTPKGQSSNTPKGKQEKKEKLSPKRKAAPESEVASSSGAYSPVAYQAPPAPAATNSTSLEAKIALALAAGKEAALSPNCDAGDEPPSASSADLLDLLGGADN